jgi:hypothetical protein
MTRNGVPWAPICWDRRDRDRVAVKDGFRRLRSQPPRQPARAAASGVGFAVVPGNAVANAYTDE